VIALASAGTPERSIKRGVMILWEGRAWEGIGARDIVKLVGHKK
jgi:hypothetical protein